jgi:predicted dehydrogenase
MLQGVVIGFGRMGLTHFSILNTHPEVKFTAVCDSSKFILNNMQKFAGVNIYENYVKMINKEKPDFVIVATPSGLHAEIVKYMVENDIHTFVEKPFSISPKQGEEILKLLETHPVINQVGYVLRYSDVFMEVKRLLDKGALGKLIYYKMEMNGPTLLKDAKNGWRSKKSEGGGCMYDFASHSIDMTNYMFGTPDEISGTVFQSIYSKDVEDALCSTFTYSNGLRGNISICWSDPSYRKPTYRLEVMGREGKIIADLHSLKAFFRREPTIPGFTKDWNQKYVTDFVEPVRFYLRGYEFTRQLDCFIDKILDHEKPCLSTFKEGYDTDVVIERMNNNAIRMGK